MINLTSGTKKLITFMALISVIIIIFSIWYYSTINSLEDPRTLSVKKLHIEYNDAVRNNDIETALSILDSMDRGYGGIAHYENSFERGVINTDKAAVYINYALYRTENDDEKNKYLEIADSLLNLSLYYYDTWRSDYSNLSDSELLEKVSSGFNDVEADNLDKITSKRADDIKLALKELDRRYSVAYTNLAIVQRHKMDVDSAAVLYKKALDMWEDNHTAKSNLNVLMGGEPLERGIIEKLIPKER